MFQSKMTVLTTFMLVLLLSDPFGLVETFPISLLSSSSVDNTTMSSTNGSNPITSNLTVDVNIPSSPLNVSSLSIMPDVNHALTIDHQNTVINLGQSLSLGITNAIVRPLTFFNNLIGSAAGSLPGLFAANGAALGTAIATPIQLGTLAANAAISGITGTLVSIPISMASGGAAQLVGLVGTGRQLWHSTLGSDPSTSSFWHNGELWMQPLAVVTGANSILAGISLNALSQGVKNLGLGIERFGVSLTHTGNGAKRLGSVLIGWANGRALYAPVINNTDTNQINIDLSEMKMVPLANNGTSSNSTFETEQSDATTILPIIEKLSNGIEPIFMVDLESNQQNQIDEFAATTIEPTKSLQ